MKDHKTYAIDESRGSRASSACTPLLILPMTLGFLTAPVHAETATADAQPSESASALQEIVVTAQRREQNLQDVPIAVTAMSDAQVQSLGIRDLQGVTIGTPGLVINNASDFENIRIRGVGANFSNAGVESPIAQYVDGVPLQNSIGAILGLLDIDSVQVLEGPQGTLYGRNATGGAILLNTANPTNQREGHVLAEYGNLNHRQIDVVFNTPVTDQVNVRFAARWDDQDGYVRNEAGGDDLGGHNTYTLRGKVDWRPSPLWDVLWGVEYFSGHDTVGSLYPLAVGAPGCQACLLFGAVPPTGFYSTTQNHTDPYYNTYLFSTLRIRRELDDYILTSVSGYRNTRFYDSADFDGTALNLFNYLYHGSFSTASEELQLASQYHGRFNFLVGLFYLNDYDTTRAEFLGEDFGPLQPSDYGTVRTSSASAFAEIYWNFTDSLSLTLGGRYNYDAKRQTAANNADAQLAFQSPGFQTSLYNNAFTPRIVLTYKTDLGSYYISRSDGFKSGGVTVPAYGPTAPVKPEKITSYEMGAKLELMNGRLRTQQDVYYYDIKDLQVEITELPAGQVTRNAARARAYGAELNAQFAATNELTVQGGASYLHARYASYPDATLYVLSPTGGYQVSSGDLSHKVVEQSPKLSADLALAYKFNVNDRWAFDFHAVGRYTTRYDFYPGGESPEDAGVQGPYGILNLSGGISPVGGSFRVGFYVNNATDKKYNNLETFYSSGFFHMPAPPITYGLNIRYDY